MPSLSGATSLERLRQLPAKVLFSGNAGGISHPVIEPYVFPIAPYEAFRSGTQNDVPLLLGSNAEDARAMVDPSHLKAGDFNASIERSFGSLPPQIIDAYPHTTDQEAEQSRIDLETDLRFV
jgi:para-nitrobenzyl esterase